MRRLIKLLLIPAALLILVLAGLAYWVQSALNTPHAHNATETSILIERGLGTRAIINRLAEAGIIGSQYPLLIWLKLGGGANLKAGEYRFPSPVTPLEVLGKLSRGEVLQYRVTIPEGFNRFEIAPLLASKTGKADEMTFERLMDDPSSIADLDPQARNLEGYLFPETYIYTSGTTAAELIKQMTDRCRLVLTPAWRARAQELGMTIHDVMTLASIIEEEAKIPSERPRISSVFHNRLKKNIPLATDPSFIYAAQLAGDYDGNVNHPRHRTRNSPYNTYIYAGLPPGPIASPGRQSIEAALYPETTDFYYFVATGVDGSHYFSRTIEEHNRAVAEYYRQRRILREQERQQQSQ